MTTLILLAFFVYLNLYYVNRNSFGNEKMNIIFWPLGVHKKVDKLFEDMMIDVPIATYTQINVCCNHQK